MPVPSKLEVAIEAFKAWDAIMDDLCKSALRPSDVVDWTPRQCLQVDEAAEAVRKAIADLEPVSRETGLPKSETRVD